MSHKSVHCTLLANTFLDIQILRTFKGLQRWNSRTFEDLACFQELSRPWKWGKNSDFQGLSKTCGNPEHKFRFTSPTWFRL